MRKIVKCTCPDMKMIIYVPVDQEIRKAFVPFQGRPHISSKPNLTSARSCSKLPKLNCHSWLGRVVGAFRKRNKKVICQGITTAETPRWSPARHVFLNLLLLTFNTVYFMSEADAKRKATYRRGSKARHQTMIQTDDEVCQK